MKKQIRSPKRRFISLLMSIILLIGLISAAGITTYANDPVEVKFYSKINNDSSDNLKIELQIRDMETNQTQSLTVGESSIATIFSFVKNKIYHFAVNMNDYQSDKYYGKWLNELSVVRTHYLRVNHEGKLQLLDGAVTNPQSPDHIWRTDTDLVLTYDSYTYEDVFISVQPEGIPDVELAGAEMKIESQFINEQWTSGELKGMRIPRNIVMDCTQVSPPPGFDQVDPVSFVFKHDGELEILLGDARIDHDQDGVPVLVMENSNPNIYEVTVKAQRHINGELLGDAEFKYFDLENEWQVKEFTSESGETTLIGKFLPERIYRIECLQAPDLYRLWGEHEREFKVDQNGQFYVRRAHEGDDKWVPQESKEISFGFNRVWQVMLSKQGKDKPNQELIGAQLQWGWPGAPSALKWISGQPAGPPPTVDVAENIPYTYKELVAPAGYKKANDIVFYLNQNGEVVISSGEAQVAQNPAQGLPPIITMTDVPDKPYWLKDNGKWYYYVNDIPVTGWQTIDGKRYYFNTSGVMQTGWLTLGGKRYYLAASGVMVKGWQTLSGKRYYFDSSGVMQTGWLTLNGKRYYLANSGVMLKGWQRLSGKRYYFDSSGVMQTGWLTLDGKRYYLAASGVMVRGWQTLSGKRYYFDSSGVMQTGWLTIDGKRYYLAASGAMAKGWQTLSGKRYYFNSEGVMQTGWLTLGGKRYYLTASGIMAKGWQTLSGKRYYFNSEGVMQTGWLTLGGKRYYLAASGAMVKGWQTLSGKRYYFNSEGVMQTGWLILGGKRYYFTTSGLMTKGWQTLSGKRYYFNSEGVMQTGWLSQSNSWYYLHSTGIMAKGWQKISHTWYYFRDTGIMQTGWLKSGSVWYYLNPSGAMASGWQKISNSWYYFSTSGVMQTGWLKLGNTWFYLNTSGAMVTGWQKINGSWYYFNASGAMLTGRQKINGTWYTFSQYGVWIP